MLRRPRVWNRGMLVLGKTRAKRAESGNCKTSRGRSCTVERARENGGDVRKWEAWRRPGSGRQADDLQSGWHSKCWLDACSASSASKPTLQLPQCFTLHLHMHTIDEYVSTAPGVYAAPVVRLGVGNRASSRHLVKNALFSDSTECSYSPSRNLRSGWDVCLNLSAEIVRNTLHRWNVVSKSFLEIVQAAQSRVHSAAFCSIEFPFLCH